ncbi:hypothetical protein B0T10DRAFT_479749 [Thelonectria olida]|uniref:Uncharacterized protein n=1 Tax=Thelonectria olida TaxID=1576542 RepID=A0A9P8W9I2_9HYPO|nr:hypothetical protein B0T10DRAFT_479749 [Thelonectria olida]
MIQVDNKQIENGVKEVEDNDKTAKEVDAAQEDKTTEEVKMIENEGETAEGNQMAEQDKMIVEDKTTGKDEGTAANDEKFAENEGKTADNKGSGDDDESDDEVQTKEMDESGGEFAKQIMDKGWSPRTFLQIARSWERDIKGSLGESGLQNMKERLNGILKDISVFSSQLEDLPQRMMSHEKLLAENATLLEKNAELSREVQRRDVIIAELDAMRETQPEVEDHHEARISKADVAFKDSLRERAWVYYNEQAPTPSNEASKRMGDKGISRESEEQHTKLERPQPAIAPPGRGAKSEWAVGPIMIPEPGSADGKQPDTPHPGLSEEKPSGIDDQSSPRHARARSDTGNTQPLQSIIEGNEGAAEPPRSSGDGQPMTSADGVVPETLEGLDFRSVDETTSPRSAPKPVRSPSSMASAKSPSFSRREGQLSGRHSESPASANSGGWEILDKQLSLSWTPTTGGLGPLERLYDENQLFQFPDALAVASQPPTSHPAEPGASGFPPFDPQEFKSQPPRSQTSEPRGLGPLSFNSPPAEALYHESQPLECELPQSRPVKSDSPKAAPLESKVLGFESTKPEPLQSEALKPELGEIQSTKPGSSIPGAPISEPSKLYFFYKFGPVKSWHVWAVLTYCVLFLCTLQVLISCRRQKHIWFEANGLTTRNYMLRAYRADRTWLGSVGIDTDLFVNWSEGREWLVNLWPCGAKQA